MNALPQSNIPVVEVKNPRFDVIIGGEDPTIVAGALEINARANELNNNRGRSTKIGEYGIGFPVDAVRRIRDILNSTYH